MVGRFVFIPAKEQATTEEKLYTQFDIIAFSTSFEVIRTSFSVAAANIRLSTKKVINVEAEVIGLKIYV